MKLINHDLRDKWILGGGATNLMIGNPELLDEPHASSHHSPCYLGEREKLMITQFGSFKSPNISFRISVLPGLNSSHFLHATMCWPGNLDYPEWNWRFHLRQRRKQAMLTPNPLKPIHPGFLPVTKTRYLVTLFSKGNVNIWHRLLGHAGMEIFWNLGFRGELEDCLVCPQGELKHSKFSWATSYAQGLLEWFHSDVMGLFIEGYWEEKFCLVLVDDMSIKVFIKTLKTVSDVIWGTTKDDYKTKNKVESSVSKGNQSWGYRNVMVSIKFTGWETQLEHHGQGSLHAYRCKLDSQAVVLSCTLCTFCYNNHRHSTLDDHKSPTWTFEVSE